MFCGFAMAVLFQPWCFSHAFMLLLWGFVSLIFYFSCSFLWSLVWASSDCDSFVLFQAGYGVFDCVLSLVSLLPVVVLLISFGMDYKWHMAYYFKKVRYSNSILLSAYFITLGYKLTCFLSSTFLETSIFNATI